MCGKSAMHLATASAMIWTSFWRSTRGVPADGFANSRTSCADQLERTLARGFRIPNGTLMVSVSLAGQTATHSRHPVHSADRICSNWSTGNAEGHAFAHFAQSIQVFELRVIRIGLRRETSPRKPPYGQR